MIVGPNQRHLYGVEKDLYFWQAVHQYGETDYPNMVCFEEGNTTVVKVSNGAWVQAWAFVGDPK